jgi:rare lipoprotein A (peptidoglycan hydrolase)
VAIVVALLAAMVTLAAPAHAAERSNSLSGSDSLSGLASYYGHEFDGQRTASGDTFDMLAMTAAHRSLPFGTRVRVTSLTSGRTAIVRINDRGPFVKGRVLDLSYAAAERLRIVGRGVGPVRIEVLPRLARVARPDRVLARRLARRPCHCRGEALALAFRTARVDVLGVNPSLASASPVSAS